MPEGSVSVAWGGAYLRPLHIINSEGSLQLPLATRSAQGQSGT